MNQEQPQTYINKFVGSIKKGQYINQSEISNLQGNNIHQGLGMSPAFITSLYIYIYIN